MLQERPEWAVQDTEEYDQDLARTWFEKMGQISQAG